MPPAAPALTLSLPSFAGLLCLLAVTPAASDSSPAAAAGVLLINGKMRTVDKGQPEVEALAVLVLMRTEPALLAPPPVSQEWATARATPA